MASLPPVAFLFNKPSDDMILTRYKGVDVTPHTFNNLIKTITNQKSISNTSASKTEFEDRIREIILAFNPTLKKNGAYMTTEYMLVNTLKDTDKKEVTHTYNYNNWGNGNQNDDVVMQNEDDDDDDVLSNANVSKKLKSIATGEWSDDKMEQLLDVVYPVNEQCVRKINKKYTKYVDGLKRKKRKSCDDNDDVVLASIKQMLCVKKIDNNLVTALCDTIKSFMKNNNTTNMCYDTIEKYIYGFRVVSEYIESSKGLLESEIVKVTEATRAQVIQEIQADVQGYESKIEAQNKKMKTLLDQCDHLNNIITQNVIEIAKLGGEAGEKDAYIEELQEDLQRCREQVTRMEDEIKQQKESIHELEAGVNTLRGDNVRLDRHNDELLQTNSQLQSQVQQLQEELKQKQEEIRVASESFYNILNKKDEDDEDKNRGYISTIQSLTNERNSLMQDKQLLQNNIVEYEEFKKNVQIRMQQLQSECVIRNTELNQKEQALHSCISRVQDQEGKYLKKLDEITELTCKLQNLQQDYDNMQSECESLKVKVESANSKVEKITQKNSELLQENEKYYEEGDVVIKENVELKSKIKKLQNKLEEVEQECKNVEVDCVNKIKNEQEKFEECKQEVIIEMENKWQQEKQQLIDDYEKRLQLLQCSNGEGVVNVTQPPDINLNNNSRKRGKSDLKSVPLKLAKTVMSVKPISRK
uniref:Desmoplakin n=1 Tax=Erinnyis ello granulovirus TaxID=307444 RepID=A0A288WJC8_9BBAC|nr:desmoplakin [Erinnyis ello granulovirus]